MNALLKFEISGSWSNTIIYVLVMDNGKYDIGSDDAVVTFDLKGSKWKHRWKDDGGTRCSPLFPLEFWEKGASPKHKADGEDLDFFALRTQVNRDWYDSQKNEAARATNKTWRSILEQRLRRYPLHDDCLSTKAAFSGKWIHGKEKKAL